MKALKEKEDARTLVCFWVKVVMAKPSFDIFLFDRLDRYNRWDRKSWDQYVVSLDPFFFGTTTMLLLLSIICKAIRFSLEANTTHPS